MNPDRKEWLLRAVIIVAFVTTIAVPFIMRKEKEHLTNPDETLIIITPHNEAIRTEFGRGFREWYQERTGKSVYVDWRVIGGTAEIARYLAGGYQTTFRLLWEREMGRSWNNEVLSAFDNSRVIPDDTPQDDSEGEAARRAFLASEVDCGLDVFFGGGSYDFIRQAAAGRLVPSGLMERHPEWFSEAIIPLSHNGEPYTDPEGRWHGAVLASFGIIHNADVYARLGIEAAPTRWSDLADDRLFGELALADPTKSSSINKAFEMVLQEAMQERLVELQAGGETGDAVEAQAVREGWVRGFQLLQNLGANARYFTDSSQKPPIDVFQGDSAAGMCIDFYGRYQAEAVSRREGRPRVQYLTPPGGSVFSVDPIGLLRGAPNREVAESFIEFVLSLEGQKLWNYRVGTPGGPQQFALRRLPVRRDAYTAEASTFMSDPEVEPYGPENDFIYHASWTGHLFREMAFVMRVVCLDTHHEMIRAWKAILDNGRPPGAVAIFTDLSEVDYETTNSSIKAALRSADPLEEIRLAKRLSNHFRDQYKRAEAAAINSRN
ncbi:MAG: extracellular solute-binding protein [Opitutaceae bacterium]